jgi:hypothetical protein
MIVRDDPFGSHKYECLNEPALNIDHGIKVQVGASPGVDIDFVAFRPDLLKRPEYEGG